MAVFWDVASCSLVGVYRRFRGACYLRYQGDERNIPEDNHLYTCCRENLKSHLAYIVYKKSCVCETTVRFIKLVKLCFLDR
jgi:hypothetical protein